MFACVHNGYVSIVWLVYPMGPDCLHKEKEGGGVVQAQILTTYVHIRHAIFADTHLQSWRTLKAS